VLSLMIDADVTGYIRKVAHLLARTLEIRWREAPSAADLGELLDESLNMCASLLGGVARAHDICQRAQEDLRAESEGWQRLFQMIPVAWLTIDSHGVIVDANASAAVLLNVSLTHLRGRLLLHFAEDRDVFARLLKTVGPDADLISASIRLRPRERAPRYVTASIIANPTMNTSRTWFLFSAATNPVLAGGQTLQTGGVPE